MKQFLHPECKMCDTLFHTRLEWDDHKLSSDHLRKVGEQRRQFNPDLKDDEFELLDVIVIDDTEPAEEIPVASKPDMLNDQEMKDDDDQDEQAVQKEPGDNEDTLMETDNEVNQIEQTDDKEENDVQDETTVATEITTNVTTTEETTVVKKDKEEKYNPANVVGRELVVKTGGHVCRICAMFMKNDEEAELHCQTASHYINFTSITKLHVS